MQETMAGIFRETARGRPGDIAMTWLRDGERDAIDISFGELDRRAARVARELAARHPAGERVLICGDAEPAFIAAFLGCLFARMIAVPSATPRGNQSLRIIESIVSDCRPVACLYAGLSARALARLQESPLLQAMDWIDVEAISSESSAGDFAPPDPQAVAYLQYTSGSTGLPRGVIITHENLLQNQRMMAEVAAHDASTRYVGWLPLFHDMGLAGIVMQSLFVGGRCILIPPRFFMQKPIRWLRAIGRYGATSSAAPDFAYDLCARTTDASEIADLDLSTWRVAISGGEPVRARTLQRFAETFHDRGFRPEAWLPCYGLAEATCLVTGPARGQLPRVIVGEAGQPMVSCGYPRQQEEIAIVDPDTQTRQPAGQVGEIWVEGPAVGWGYWGRPEDSAETFNATLAGDSRTWLRTGDLGIISEGELFVCGRLKDLIIIRGSNHHPHAIEQTVQTCNPAFADARGAAFSIPIDLDEHLVIVQEIARSARLDLDADEAIADIRQAVAAEHGIQPYAILLVRPASLPVTTSNKIQRRESRRRMQAGELEIVARA